LLFAALALLDEDNDDEDDDDEYDNAGDAADDDGGDYSPVETSIARPVVTLRPRVRYHNYVTSYANKTSHHNAAAG